MKPLPHGLLLLPLVLAPFAALHAQRRQPPEFTQQVVLVPNFWVAGANATPSRARDDLRLGRRIGDEVRDRLADLVTKREARLVGGFEIRQSFDLAGYMHDAALTITEMRQQGQTFRTDEIVLGIVTRQPNGGVRVEGRLLLWRDVRQRQPIEPVAAPTVDRAAAQFARMVHQARVQLPYQRRCENSLRAFQNARAVQHAREGIAAYGRGALVRTCLLWAMRANGAPFEEILREARTLLDIDPGAFFGLETAAVAFDSLKRRAEAADMWLRVAATDSNNVELIERVVRAMAEGGNSKRAEPLIVRVSDANPAHMGLMRQRWRVANDNRNWPLAIAAGEKLLEKDAEAVGDSVFYLRLASAYRANGQIFKAMELVARGVSVFPKDARLYAMYTQFVKEEGDSVLPRGLALYPHSAELLALNAKELRSKGMVAEALDASKRAVELDSTIAQGRLMVAQAEIELGRPDSALATLRRALPAGEDTATVAQFALSKGNVLFRAANGTKTRADFQLAMRFLALADSLRPTPQTKFLLGASALSVAQTALTDAPTLKAKEESCIVAQLGAETLPIAREGLTAGRDVSPEATKQYLEYLDLISPYAEKQIAAFCAPAVTAR